MSKFKYILDSSGVLSRFPLKNIMESDFEEQQ